MFIQAMNANDHPKAARLLLPLPVHDTNSVIFLYEQSGISPKVAAVRDGT